MKGGVAMDPTTTRRKTLPEYCSFAGGPSRSPRQSGDPAAIPDTSAERDRMDEAVARFAAAYAGQTDRDHDALVKAAKQKRIPVARTAVKVPYPHDVCNGPPTSVFALRIRRALALGVSISFFLIVDIDSRAAASSACSRKTGKPLSIPRSMGRRCPMIGRRALPG